jgi:myo-inositol 2-dehydrogenase/D-chiro-inositol 1-dehydrogenase
MNARPRIGLIGVGRIGQVHLRTILAHPELAELAILVDANSAALSAAQATYRLPAISADVGALFDDPDIDAVIIASSTDTHAPYITEAARTGKSAFTEKPIALDIETTDAALAAVNRAGTRLQVGFQRRFDAPYAAARRQIEDGRLGRIEMIRDAMRDPSAPPASYLQVSGGLFRDMTIHNLDCVRWLRGENPVEIYAVGSALTSPDVGLAGDIDTSVIVMTFADGSLATIENSRRSGFGYDVRTEVFGSTGALMIGDHRQVHLRAYDADGVHEDHQHFFLDRFARAYELEVMHFLESVANDTEPAVTGHDGRVALHLAFAAEQSRRTGLPVHLDPATGQPLVAEGAAAHA